MCRHEDILQKVIEEIAAVIKCIKTRGVTAEQLRRAKQNCAGKFMLHLDSANGIAENVAHEELFMGGSMAPDEYMRGIQRVTNRDLMQLARETFTPENCSIAIVGPLDPKEYEQKIVDLVQSKL